MNRCTIGYWVWQRIYPEALVFLHTSSRNVLICFRYFCSFSAFDCCIFTYASVINTPTHFSECCSGGFHAAQTRARTAELNPGSKMHTRTSPHAKMTIKPGGFSQKRNVLSSAQWKYIYEHKCVNRVCMCYTYCNQN